MRRRTFVRRMAAGALACALLRDELLGRAPEVVEEPEPDVVVGSVWDPVPDSGGDSFEVYVTDYAIGLVRPRGTVVDLTLR